MEYARYKMCIFGDGGVGKTTLINRYITGKYSDSSLINLEEWLKILRKAPDEEHHYFPLLLVGGKADLELEGKRVTEREYAYEHGKKYNLFEGMECSSKTGLNVELIFETLARKMLGNSGLI